MQLQLGEAVAVGEQPGKRNHGVLHNRVVEHTEKVWSKPMEVVKVHLNLPKVSPPHSFENGLLEGELKYFPF